MMPFLASFIRPTPNGNRSARRYQKWKALLRNRIAARKMIDCSAHGLYNVLFARHVSVGIAHRASHLLACTDNGCRLPAATNSLNHSQRGDGGNT